MTLDEQIAWLEQEAAKHLAAAGRRNERAAVDIREAELSRGAMKTWLDDNAKRKQAQGKKLRERAATLLTIENTLRALRDAQG
jgi:hypothetical protein